MRTLSFSRYLLAGWLCCALVLLAGCDSNGDDSDEDTGPQAAGVYEAQTFVAQADGVLFPINVLSSGGRVDLTLRADETVSGKLLIPASLAVAITGVDQDIIIDFSGTYEQNGNTVRFDVVADDPAIDTSFIQDEPWTYDAEEETLQAEIIVADQAEADITLIKTGTSAAASSN